VSLLVNFYVITYLNFYSKFAIKFDYHLRDNKLQSEIQERSYEEIMDAYRNRLTNLNISLCRECLLPIKLEEGDYCDSCQPE
jgi:hypothetical protein